MGVINATFIFDHKFDHQLVTKLSIEGVLQPQEVASSQNIYLAYVSVWILSCKNKPFCLVVTGTFISGKPICIILVMRGRQASSDPIICTKDDFSPQIFKSLQDWKWTLFHKDVFPNIVWKMSEENTHRNEKKTVKMKQNKEIDTRGQGERVGHPRELTTEQWPLLAFGPIIDRVDMSPGLSVWPKFNAHTTSLTSLKQFDHLKYFWGLYVTGRWTH